MADFQRGVIKKMTFEIEYPDGSRKVSELEDPENVGMIVFDSNMVPVEDLEQFNVSESEWKENPSMMVYGRPAGPGVNVIPGRPFCTHNRCS